MAKSTDNKKPAVKRFMVFAGTDNENSSNYGWDAFKGSFGTKKAAINLSDSLVKGSYDWGYVVDTATGRVVV